MKVTNLINKLGFGALALVVSGVLGVIVVKWRLNKLQEEETYLMLEGAAIAGKYEEEARVKIADMRREAAAEAAVAERERQYIDQMTGIVGAEKARESWLKLRERQMQKESLELQRQQLEELRKLNAVGGGKP